MNSVYFCWGEKAKLYLDDNKNLAKMKHRSFIL